MSKLRRLLSFICCICFISSFVMHFPQNTALADETCSIKILGDNFSVADSAYNYTTDGESSGSMSVIYQADASSQPVECNPGADGKITDIPQGSIVAFCLTPNQGFVPKLQINGADVSLMQSPENKSVYVGSLVATGGEISAQANFVTGESASISLNLKCIVDEDIKNSDYDDNFKSAWGTIEYSDDGGTTYKQLNEGTTAGGDGKYTFDSSINEIKLKVTWTNEIMAFIDQDLLQNGSEVLVEKGDHTVVFQEAVCTVIWAYPSAGIDDDSVTKNGKISIDPGDGIEGTENENGGIYSIAPGTEVTIHLNPDYGYQFSKSAIGENLEVTPSENQSTFTFTMPKDQVVIGDIFTAHSDEVNTMSDSIVSGNISGADKFISSGNVSLSISDALISEEQKLKADSFAYENALEPVSYLDTELSNFLIKGNTGDKWENILETTPSPIAVSLTLSEELKKSDSYSIIKINGNDISVVDANYNSSEGILNFEADSFSTFVIAKKTDDSGNGILSVGSFKTGDQSKFWLYSIIMAASVAGFIYSFKKSKKNKFRI